jgi:hypothetical protein
MVDQFDGFVFFGTKAPTAPNILQLQLLSPDPPILNEFIDQKERLSDLQNLILVLTCLSTFNLEKQAFSAIFEGNHTRLDAEFAGRFILRDKQLVSIGYGRRKERQLYLFENWLVFSRPRGAKQIIVQKVPIDRLLLVFYRRQDVGAGILTVYWSEAGCNNQIGSVHGADIFFDCASSLALWAGYLAVATTARVNQSANQGRLKEPDIWPMLSFLARESFKRILELGPISIQQALSLILPSLRGVKLDPENRVSLSAQFQALGKRVDDRNHKLGKYSSTNAGLIVNRPKSKLEEGWTTFG